ncbi:MAG: N-acetylmuramoyl-L-alanine amidase [Candidatus Omnitrophica bacterium]|nr:N-acetylmuramoyl-L-alanine amidase [Candidatus Omnitrophota bacterium]
MSNKSFISGFVILPVSVFLLFSFLLSSSWAQVGKFASSFTYAVKIGDKTFLPVLPFCLENGIDAEWDGVARRVIFRKAGRFLTLMPDVTLANIDGAVRPLDQAPKEQFGALLIPEAFTRADWWPWKFSGETKEITPARPLEPKKQRIVIDPGHGGFDQGAVGAYGLMEKELVLQISNELARQLSSAGMEVVMTRTDDRFVPLEERSKMAAQSEGGLFISVHANAAKSKAASGFEIYYLSEAIDDYARAVAAYENSAVEFEVDKAEKPPVDPTVWDILLTEKRRESIMLAKLMSGRLTRSRLTKNRGVKGAEFRVLMNTRVPALLLELGFVSNPQEARNLADPAYQRQLVLVLEEGILEYLEEYETTNRFTI